MKKTFEIEYKLRYYETEDYHVESVKAINTKDALRIFANRKKIRDDLNIPEKWVWEDGVWWAFFKKIREVKNLTT